MFDRLVLDSFGAFKSAELEFSKGLNVFIGENGTGKTHLMKLMYCMQQQREPEELKKKLVNVFRPSKGQVSRLVFRKKGSTSAKVKLIDSVGNAKQLEFDNTRHKKFELKGKLEGSSEPVFIPVKEVLSFAPGFISLYDKYELAFEEVYYDIIKQAYLPARKGMPLQDEKPILELIRKTVGGRVSISGEEFQLTSGNSKLEMSLVAEGHRKLALIWQLIHNGAMFSNNTLFWDEPEANLNPSLMKGVAQILVMLAERGVQIFIATHNYAFLKELDFASAGDARYFALEKTKEGVVPHAFTKYESVTPNKIADEYLRLYDLEISSSLGGVK
ncbi:TPA: AAA family ATPase [Vibrio parahaemolyticus]|uniref:AAA family ATPase n=1 Tax=Vibrio parahaemolyticus TaxID=670 RepID=UPI0010E5BD88|nr:AAA family ATPase [Vibrio parahaemolyticus]EHK0843144.1 AAA family ATPase [Vibrio parahaemolyticus]EII3141999.1 AAA family ATPase [Vibrio parahaemolyticus]EJB8409666.1 AAA family ATPase [Vibrio parahaemolyticus]EJB8535520.1 AAA family ATPase [Vibrio parahaemolyticus]EJE4188954.1 AAA family ATPase [Vibrio parahaemolyticus]